MSKKENTKITIVYIGKFVNMYDEEYIARSFESIGCKIIRVDQTTYYGDIMNILEIEKPNYLLFHKWNMTRSIYETIKRLNIKTICWLFDLYWGYHREYLIQSSSFFRADYLFTTDAGHDSDWEKIGLNHKCIRQGIYKEDCYISPVTDCENDIVFVGSDNPIYPERKECLKYLNKYLKFKWFGKINTNDVRGKQLNELFSKSKIVVGDSYPSPFYWSNRVVETLGRGGFLIHQETEGLKDEYPNIVTYEKNNWIDLRNKIEYYMIHEDQRLEIIKKNFNLVKRKYTMDKKCRELLLYISDKSPKT